MTTRMPTCAIILAGGRGTRIRQLYPDVPKPFIPVAGRPFIAWVMDHLATQGCTRMIVSLGHLAALGLGEIQVLRRSSTYAIATVVETEALGTAGAITFAATEVGDADCVVVGNGDSLALANLRAAHALMEELEADGALVTVEVADASRYGTLEMDATGHLLAFHEKRPGPGWVNTGIYIFRRSLFVNQPVRPASLEHDVLPNMLASGIRLAAYRTRVPFVDMGTPDGLQEAIDLLSKPLSQEDVR